MTVQTLEPQVQTTQIKTLKLSDYIRQGAKIRPQARYQLFHYDDFEHQWTSCALGAAYEAMTDDLVPSNLITMEEAFKKLREVFPTVLDDTIQWPRLVAPSVGYKNETAVIVTMVLNDRFHWSREEIADYLESRGV